MKTLKPSTVSAGALAFLIEHAKAHHGFMDVLAERMSATTGQKIYRQYINQWLHDDPARRVEPKLGIGLLLIREGRKLAQETNMFIRNEDDAGFLMVAFSNSKTVPKATVPKRVKKTAK